MKNKILSSVLAASMVISCCAMNVFAASTAHTVTIKPSKTTELTKGETIVVELIMDNTEKLVSCQYQLNYDTTAFEVDTTKVSRLEKCIDSTWMSDIKNADGDWAYYLGNPTYKVNADEGFFNFQWAGAEGVEAEYAVDNRVIGKFNITVKADAPDGEYTFALTDAKTMDAGENSQANMVCTPVKVTVGEPAPTTKTVGFSTVLDYVAGKTGVRFAVTTDDAAVTTKTKTFDVPFNTTVESKVTGCTIGLNVNEVPADVTLTATAALY